jgi:hypothetical protein
VIPKEAAQERGRDLAIVLFQEKGSATPAMQGRRLIHPLPSDRTGEIDLAPVLGPPPPGNDQIGETARDPVPVLSQMAKVAYRADSPHLLQGPMLAARFQNVGFLSVGDEEGIIVTAFFGIIALRTAVREATLAIASDQVGGHLDPLVRAAGALQDEPHEVGTAKRLLALIFVPELGVNRGNTDRDSVFVNPVLIAPMAVRTTC